MMKSGIKYLILAATVLIFAGLNAGGYLALTHRHVDAAISLNSTPLSSSPISLHKTLSFKVAVANMLGPMKSYKAYQGIAGELARNFGLPLELVTAKSYAEVNDLLRTGQVDVAFVCAGSAATGREAMDVIAAEVVKGAPVFYALIIVPADSPAQSLLDLKGKNFLYTDPDSQTGHWYPARRLLQLGQDPATFFSSVRWTQTHDRSVLAISQHMSDGASVSSVIYNLLVLKDPALAGRIRILERSVPFPSPPVAVRRNLPVKERNVVLKTLLGLKDSEEGRMLLEEIGIEGFVPASNSDYLAISPAETGE